MTTVRTRALLNLRAPSKPRTARRLVGALTALWVAALAGACGSDESSGSGSTNPTACDPAVQVCSTGAMAGAGGFAGAAAAAGVGATAGTGGGSSGAGGSNATGGVAGAATDAGSGGGSPVADGGGDASGGGMDASSGGGDSGGGSSDAGGGGSDTGAGGGSGGADSGGGGSTPPPDGLLAQCTADSDCSGSLLCYDPDGDGVGAYCTESCADGGSCSDQGGVAASCSPAGDCRVDCAGSGTGDGTCPPLMECVEIQVFNTSIFRCQYPADVTPADAGGGGGSGPLAGELTACSGNADCGTDQVCYGAAFAPAGTLGFCTRSCTGDSDCYDHDGVDFTCGTTGGGGASQGCRVDCGAGGTNSACPTDMVCADIFNGAASRCLLLDI